MYIKLLQYLCRKQLKKIADNYPQSRKDLIRYHDFMAIECVNKKTKAQDRVLGISIATANMLENNNISITEDAGRDSILLLESVKKIDKLLKEKTILEFELKELKYISVKRLTCIQKTENVFNEYKERI